MIDNAIKYGRPAADWANRCDRLVADTREIRIAVADRGPGIPAADRDRVLKRFVRLEASRTRPGTGLGLSLVAAVARLHGGRILLEDNAPGLRIVLVLPQSGKVRSAMTVFSSITPVLRIFDAAKAHGVLRRVPRLRG